MQTTKLGKFVSDFMKENSLSSYDVERASKNEKGEWISQSSVSKIIRGETKNPSVPKQKALARGLGIPETVILGITGGSAADTDIGRTINSYINELPENVQEDVLLIVEALYKKYVK